MSESNNDPWRGLRASAKARLETRNYSSGPLSLRLGTTGLNASEAISSRGDLSEVWIPGVELFPRRVFQQKGRGYFGELTRLNQGILDEIGLSPRQWASALMHRDSAKGFHIHPPFIPEGREPAGWFRELYVDGPKVFQNRPYDQEQWDVMFFLTGICEMILTDEREGMPKRSMRFVISGDSRPGPDNAGVVIPPGVGHALRNIGNEDLIMVYGTTTVFNPEWEGRIESSVENSPLPEDWQNYLEDFDRSRDSCK
jgi:dTDP-4-dehydrorhamnose 3,5-epimerase-like enzyme